MEDDKIDVYVTKYLFSKGIQKRSVYKKPNQYSGNLEDAEDGIRFNYSDQEYFHTWEEAVAKAKEMQAKRIKSLEKQLQGVKTLTFERPEEES